VADTWDGRKTIVCTYGGGISVVTLRHGEESQSVQYTAEEGLKLAEEIAEVARAQLGL
jgi:hypothetical protein